MEETILDSVTTFPALGAVNVCWKLRVRLSSGDAIDAGTRRYAYMADQRDKFVADIEDPAKGGTAGMAAPYLAAMGW